MLNKVTSYILTLIIVLFILVPKVSLAQLTPFVPDDPFFGYEPDTLPGSPGQWYFVNQAPESLTIEVGVSNNVVKINAANVGLDSNVQGSWNKGLTGEGVVIGIVGLTGIAGDHPDLVENYREKLSKNFSQDSSLADSPQGPQSDMDNHDTAVAGVSSARGGNGIGITGLAPFSGSAGLRVSNPTNEVTDDSNLNYRDAYYWASGVDIDGAINDLPDIQIKNHSYARVPPFIEENQMVIDGLNNTAKNNIIHAFAAGNFRGSPNGDTNRMQRNSLNSVITVAALGSDGIFADYSNYGTSIFLTTPAARTDFTGFLILTLDRVDDLGFNPGNPEGIFDIFPDQNYTSIFNGTSATAPIVSGAMALAKQIQPHMCVRMAKHALATTCRVVDADDKSETSFNGWVTNSAGNNFNPNYGFGNIDVNGFVEKVRDT
ncbi:MAG: S8 family serine peptidase, partial [Bacteroidetes bacterium]|nr:S8 family serine peptidase [Bacteroidota bacterium]